MLAKPCKIIAGLCEQNWSSGHVYQIDSPAHWGLTRTRVASSPTLGLTGAAKHPAGRQPRQLPVLALLFLVPLQEGAGKLTQAEATLRRQLTHSFLHSQVAAAEALTDLATTVGARGLLLLQPGIC